MADSAVLGAARNAMAVNESNAKMGLVCATPTAGSAGCLPAVLTVAIEKLGLNESQQLDFLFTAGAFGLVIANKASISGAEEDVKPKLGLPLLWLQQLLQWLLVEHLFKLAKPFASY